MKEFSYCPICANKLKSRLFKDNIKLLSCQEGVAHYISFKLQDQQMSNMTLYLDNYSYLEMDFLKQISTYYYDPLNGMAKLVIPKIIEPDFPQLKNLKEKLLKYVLFT